ncbi:MAG: hypothetical protein MJZ03_00280 [archaeon]|nr:hypothetical protein [archaeon]
MMKPEKIFNIFSFLEHKYKDYKLNLLHSEDCISCMVNFRITINTGKTLRWEVRTSIDVLFSEERMVDYLTAEIEKAIHTSKKAERIQQHKEHLIPKICSCCGGRILGDKCEYCGTEFMLVKE